MPVRDRPAIPASVTRSTTTGTPASAPAIPRTGQTQALPHGFYRARLGGIARPLSEGRNLGMAGPVQVRQLVQPHSCGVDPGRPVTAWTAAELREPQGLPGPQPNT